MVSLVVPIYNEEEIISLLHNAILEAMSGVDEDWEVVYVNDGSRDRSLNLLLQLQQSDPHVVAVDLSRNWGHMGALTAGLKTAKGDAIVMMDGDLQDPPAVIPEMISAWRRGAQVVTAVRRSREESRKALAVLFPMFYRVLGALSDFPIPLNSGIFGLMDRKALDSVNALTENNRYLPGLKAWVGYRTEVVYYDRADRAGGDGKLSFMSRIKYALDAICSFSYKPLRAAFLLAALAVCFAVVLAIAVLGFSGPQTNPAFGSELAIAAVFFIGGIILFAVGVVGEYMGRIYDEVRGRPLSIINHVYRTNPAAEAALPEMEPPPALRAA